MNTRPNHVPSNIIQLKDVTRVIMDKNDVADVIQIRTHDFLNKKVHSCEGNIDTEYLNCCALTKSG